MISMKRAGMTFVAGLLVAGLVSTQTLSGQGGGQAPAGRGGQGQGQGRGGPGGRGGPQATLPTAPTAVALPTLSAEVTGPGAIYESVQSLPPGLGLDHYKYEAKEYFVSGTAQGQPYRTRIVVRKPADNARFSGLVLVESMHGSGSAHMFEYTSHYTMTSGHAAVEILTTNPQQQFVQFNEARYKELLLADVQRNEIFAQVGALIRTGTPLGGAKVRKMVLAGTSQTAGFTIGYLPAHMVYRTPQNERIYDGFMPTSNGATIQDIDVPIVHIPTMHEVSGQNITWRQDSDEAGKQYRLYEFSGMAHIDTRDSARMKPNPCAQDMSTYPLQAYMSVALNHLYNWIDKGVVPPRAERMWLDRNSDRDGSPIALDEHGNPRGGIRSPYVDVPAVKYGIRPAVANPLPPNPSAYIARGGTQAANQMCGLAGYQVPFSKDQLKKLYRSKGNFVSMVERRVAELEKAGWSLAMYRDMILGDAKKIDF